MTSSCVISVSTRVVRSVVGRPRFFTDPCTPARTPPRKHQAGCRAAPRLKSCRSHRDQPPPHSPPSVAPCSQNRGQLFGTDLLTAERRTRWKPRKRAGNSSDAPLASWHISQQASQEHAALKSHEVARHERTRLTVHDKGQGNQEQIPTGGNVDINRKMLLLHRKI